ncbi:retropepsin-like aspartic protease family protein [Variovorax sp. RB2P76]|jgi:aspartyl protease family protein|uniref:retropepsin-like aspartic protease family protein n=1 Tax=Variovorax sp. RB2P76 TaxID=3443736 RepID=UPI003F46610C
MKAHAGAKRLLLAAVAAQLMAAAAVAHAASSVTLTGSIGSRAILIVNGNAPKTVAVGESYQGVKLVSLQAEQAVVELEGKRVNLRMDTPVSIGGGAATGGGGSRVVLTADSRGHFMTQGAINGRPVTFMLDTGATSIALSMADAQRIGLDYTKGQRVQIGTANGTTQGYRLRVQSVRVGDVEVYDIDAVVSPESMPFVLLGNSFITRFSMRRDADQMVLEKRY